MANKPNFDEILSKLEKLKSSPRASQQQQQQAESMLLKIKDMLKKRALVMQTYETNKNKLTNMAYDIFHNAIYNADINLEIALKAAQMTLDIDEEGLIDVTPQNLQKIDREFKRKRLPPAGKLLVFNYSTPLSPLQRFTKENPLDTHPLVVFITNIGKGSDGAEHFVGFNIHHLPANLRKLFWNFIITNYLIAKNRNRRLEVPERLYYVLKDNPELNFALQGYRRYSWAVAKNVRKVPIREYKKIFTPSYRARFYVYNKQMGKLVPRGK
jgi:hypothetical protein